MKYSSENLIEEFYQENKSKYPNLTKEQVKDICFGPWEHLKKEMRNGNLEEVRIKYFGVFKVHRGRAKGLISLMKQKFEEGKITEKRFNKITNMLTNFLQRHENNN